MDRRIAVICLGYVGLPVATTGGRLRYRCPFSLENFTRDTRPDRQGRAGGARGAWPALHRQGRDLRTADFHVVTMPTPIDTNKAAGASRPTVGERRAANSAGKLDVCLRKYRPTHDNAKETRCGSTSPR